MSRRVFPGIAIALASAALVVGATRGVDAWRYGAALRAADRDLSMGRFEEAGRAFAAVEGRWPGRGEAESRHGLCAEALGHFDEALDAWGRVPPGAAGADRIALRRGLLALDHGRFAVAEVALEAASKLPGPRRAEAREALARLLRLQGRLEDVRELLQDGWGEAKPSASALVALWQLDGGAFPVEGVLAALERAGAEAPEDDRVWLGRANLATRAGRLDEAAGWLAKCERRRPADRAVLRALLAHAMAAGSPDVARRAMAGLPADSSAAELARLRAWFAAREGGPDAERRALEALLVASPADPAALSRLADLAAAAGEAETAAGLRARKAELDRARLRYRDLLDRADPTSHALELSGLAETLGRTFEARGWATLRVARAPSDREARALLARRKSAGSAPPAEARSAKNLLAAVAPPRAQASAARAAQDAGPEPPAFADEAEVAGLHFAFRNGQTPSRQLPETMSGGVALLDFDGDGHLDVYAVQGGTFPPPDRAPCGDRLFRNKGDGTFEDATAAAGLDRMPGGYGHGVAVGDVDNDGLPDVFVTRWRGYALYRNKGDGTFEDATAAAGLGGDRDWPTSATFADLDGDGDLDLYVCHYLAWDPADLRPCLDPETGRAKYCHPRGFEALPDHLFRNDGGRFVDVSSEAGIVDHDGRGLGVVAADLDGDGRVDLFVANDTTANSLFRNLGGLRFEEVGEAAGVAANADGGFPAGMGIACGDLDGDGQPDLCVTNFYGEGTTFYRNLGGGLFADHSAASGLTAATRYLLGFGLVSLDADADGRLDLAIANGHVNDSRPVIPYAMPSQLLLGRGEGRLLDVSGRAGTPWSTPRVGRGLAVGDFDNDGRPDLVLIDQGGPLAYFRNRATTGHTLTLRLEGVGSNRDAVGARVALKVGGREQVSWRIGGGSYQSASDPRLHFGLGEARRVDSLEVTWPSGRVDRFGSLEADAGYLIREGAGAPEPLAGFRAVSGPVEPSPAARP